ncbi:LPXTG cell wall anchor domain-containing protein [Levilactobacillus fuyuanensis]|uniref:LPXTG cell wall anchor domain-containing protein n=1 Tax=Levilactobacillus fuyuanensis TaxID=2486022 RepID=A0ABW4GYZ7_9LACO|nr:LPXTG cell wall anchor domain-containing protein [Levilactobacillus fuyuanensis]
MMKMKWQHGVMVSLFIGGLLVGSGGSVVGLADETVKYDMDLEFFVEAINDGDQTESKWVYSTEKRQVVAGEALEHQAFLIGFLTSGNRLAPEAAPTAALKWTYSGLGLPVKVTVKYTDQNDQQIGQSHVSSAKFTRGGKMIIEAPAGYRLVTPEVKNRLATTSETWNIKVTPLNSAAKPMPGGEEKPDSKPDEGSHNKPQTVPDKPDVTEKPQPGNPGASVKPTLPIAPHPGQPTDPGHPVLPTPAPLVPSRPSSSLPITHPELVVPVDEYPGNVSNPNVIYTPEGPINATDLDHTSELTERPVTAVDGSTPATDTIATSKPAKRTTAASQAKPHRTASPLQRIATSGQRLPQTDEQTTKGSLLGMVALAGLGLVRFRRFLH